MEASLCHQRLRLDVLVIESGSPNQTGLQWDGRTQARRASERTGAGLHLLTRRACWL